MSLQPLTEDVLDTMMLELVKEWESAPWFWNYSDQKSIDDVLKSTLLRAGQTMRGRHQQERLVDWMPIENPRILFLAAVVLGTADANVRKLQGDGLVQAIARHWEQAAMDDVFAWMHDRTYGDWSTCRKTVVAQQGVLNKSSFLLMEHLSENMQARLVFCRDFNIKPTHRLLVPPDPDALVVSDLGMLL